MAIGAILNQSSAWVSDPITCTFTTTGWTTSGSNLIQSVDCAGLLTSDDQRTTIVPVGNASDPAAQALTDAAFSMVDYWACNENGKLYARIPGTTKPTTNFNVNVIITR